MAEYKLTFGDRILTFPQWNGYVCFQSGPGISLSMIDGVLVISLA